ncbi:WD40 repeat-like protein [Dacryopinax primogenitus]|uniref:WD40 repeat-like protein n=1 Tax=Dacryopinax primogenitus (strain DJM 731) TaxID=1858805 RepID=M5FWD3_DACPD|nr:WD40 repeat-like protein [Dacryopinax primogenitus]EJT97691.1 WD40 repeat-like protein [Dacryopinax primogenitus]
MSRPALKDRTNLTSPSSLTAYFNRTGRENSPPSLPKRGVKRGRDPRSSDVEWELSSPCKSSPLKDELKRSGDVDEDVDVDMLDEVKPRRMERRPAPAWPSLITDFRHQARVRPYTLSLQPHLHSFRSSNHTDVFRFPSPLPQRETSIPFSLQFLHSRPLLAIGTEEGRVLLVDTQKRRKWDPQPQYTTLTPHENAVFALAFSEDDSLLATGSGDRNCVITDLASQSPITTLEGHTGSLRRVTWDPENPRLLGTAARDGSFRIWDVRLASTHACILHVPDAHSPPVPGKHMRKGRKPAPRASVTGLEYAGECRVITSGSGDGILKLWDTRSPLLPIAHSPPSPRGILALTLTPSPSSSSSCSVLALSASSHIRAYDPLTLGLSGVVAQAEGEGRFKPGSFYVRMQPAPGGGALAVGSAGGGVMLFPLSSPLPSTSRGSPTPTPAPSGVFLQGHDPLKEVALVAWLDGDTLATGGDDGLVRIWRGGPGLAEDEEGEGEGWWGVRAE